MTQTPAIEDLPPPKILRQWNCWRAAVDEYNARDRVCIVLIKSRHTIDLPNRWWTVCLRPFGWALVELSWITFAVGQICMRKKFAHCLVACKTPTCSMSYEPPSISPDVLIPPITYEGKWRAWKQDCKCIREKMLSKK